MQTSAASTQPGTYTRRASSSDLEVIKQLHNSAHSTLAARGKHFEIAPLDVEYTKQAINERRCFVLLYDGTIVGKAFIKHIDTLTQVFPEEHQLQFIPEAAFASPGPWGYLHSVVVDPSLQGKGLGTAFVKDILGYLKTEGLAKTVFLDCQAKSQNLRAFYEGLEFSLLGIVPEMSWEVAFYRYSISAIIADESE